jgi:3-hydroxypropanoate dehydrogenase
MGKSMAQLLDSAALDQLFDQARTHNKWQARDVPDALLQSIVEHMKWAPTSANCSPARFIFVKSQEAKARLKPHLSAGNVKRRWRRRRQQSSHSTFGSSVL